MIRVLKKWRELPKEERFDIPTKKFNISKEAVERIRKVENPRKRLVEAAQIQYEQFNDIHSYLTTWIAGYGSDVIIRQKFGSTQNLLDLFFKRIKYPKMITPSWGDIKRRIKIPERMSLDLAEETGIHIGDGNMNGSPNKSGTKSYRYTISGDLTNESFYHKIYIKNLMKKMYNIETKILERKEKGNIDSRIKSRLIVEFKNKILGLPVGNKKNIKIPELIMKKKNLARRCAVGIIDTDFSIADYLAITGKLNSLFVVEQLAKIFTDNNIPFKLTKYKKYGRFYIRKEGAMKIIEKWKLKNPKHTSKYLLYKKFGDTFPFSTTSERMDVINGKMNIKELQNICNKRRDIRPGQGSNL